MDRQNNGHGLNQGKKPLVLKYAKRRYDGGSEIKLIEYIEAQRALSSATAPHTAQTETDIKTALSQSTQTADETKSLKMKQALLTGPIEVAVGLVGMMTAGIAILAFKQFNNTEMAAHCKQIFKDCHQTFWQGIKHGFTGIGQAFHISMGAA